MRESHEGGEKLKKEKYAPKHSCETDPLIAHFFQKFYIKMWSSRDTVMNVAFKGWMCSRAEFCSLVSSWATRAALSATSTCEGRT